MKCIEIRLKVLGLDNMANMETELTFPDTITEDQAINLLKAFVEPVESIKEVCAWDNLPNGESTTQCGNLSVFIDDDFRYCPYCGKPIRIKGE